MACRGVLFALEKSEVDLLRAMDDEDDRVAHVSDVIEERELGGQWAGEIDKAWDAIHRCFDHGNLTLDGGEYPLNHLIMGGEQLVTTGEYYISLKSLEQVRHIAAKIDDITEPDLRARYRRIDPKNYGMRLSDEDESYTWDNFSALPDFYKRAAKAGRSVIFTVDQ